MTNLGQRVSLVVGGIYVQILATSASKIINCRPADSSSVGKVLSSARIFSEFSDDEFMILTICIPVEKDTTKFLFASFGLSFENQANRHRH